MTQAFYNHITDLLTEVHAMEDHDARNRITILTPVIRLPGAIEAARSVQAARAATPDLDVRHVMAYWPGEPDWSRVKVAAWFSDLMRQQPPGWLFIVDDDNRMHPDLLATFLRERDAHPDAWAFVFGMHHPDVHRQLLPARLPPRPGLIDGGQMMIWRDYAVTLPWQAGPSGDGEYLAAIYEKAPHRWVAVEDVVTLHNNQEVV